MEAHPDAITYAHQGTNPLVFYFHKMFSCKFSGTPPSPLQVKASHLAALAAILVALQKAF